MSDTRHDALWVMLADGEPHRVADLCAALDVDAGGLNRLRLMLPETVRDTLKQDDGVWQLRAPSVVFLQEDWTEFSAAESLNVRIVADCASTNSELLQAARTQAEDTHRTVLVANRQTAGRGRQEKVWLSPAGDSAAFSLAWLCRQPQSQIGALPLVLALSCHKVLTRFGVPVSIKWPNDLMIEHAKLGGILVESIPQQEGCIAVMGVGLNFRAPPIEEYAACGIWEHAPEINPTVLLKALVHELARDVQWFLSRGFSVFQTQYIAACRDHNQPVALLRRDEIVARGKVLGVDSTGALLLENKGVVERVVSGEISLRSEDDALVGGAEQMLLLDCGNSQLKWAWVINKEIVGTFRAPYHRLSLLGDFCRAHRTIRRVCGSAVCGEIKKLQVAEQIPHRIEWFASEKIACGIRNHYRHIGEHGADRWFNALGARSFSDRACVVVSCGTAVTVDALTASNQYLGGSILPGFNLMKESLALRTANLDRPFGRIYPFATTTPNAIASGIMDAIVGAVMLMHRRLSEREAPQPVDVILTGGGAHRIHANLPPSFLLDTRVQIVDNLVIFGLLNRIEQS
ncbi:MAG: biotin--[acetyl-CoA-carboxylase] ligase [Neisseria sp.]|nr:biotin--[acetyl-CoA-carboxylase] ligase [Neisseria sp.]